MTDTDDVQLDNQLRDQYLHAKADISRERQKARHQARVLQSLGLALASHQETLNLWESPSQGWRWTYAPHGNHFAEDGLPEWKDVHDTLYGIVRLVALVADLERQMRERQIV